MRRSALLAVLILAVLPSCRGAKPKGTPLADPELEHGRQIYSKYCVACHGESGRGDGPSAHALPVPARDFVAGSFRYASGGPGALPSDADLLRTVTYGPPTMTMPSFSSLPDADRLAVVKYVKSLCPRFAAGESFLSYHPASR